MEWNEAVQENSLYWSLLPQRELWKASLGKKKAILSRYMKHIFLLLLGQGMGLLHKH